MAERESLRGLIKVSSNVGVVWSRVKTTLFGVLGLGLIDDVLWAGLLGAGIWTTEIRTAVCFDRCLVASAWGRRLSLMQVRVCREVVPLLVNEGWNCVAWRLTIAVVMTTPIT
jgi:hypothetical protein